MLIVRRWIVVAALMAFAVGARADSLWMAAKTKSGWKEFGGGATWRQDLTALRVEPGKSFKELKATLEVYNVSENFSPWGGKWPKPADQRSIMGKGKRAGGHNWIEFSRVNVKQTGSRQLVVVRLPKKAGMNGLAEAIFLIAARK